MIVAYSGGFGPTLSVLDRGGVRSRVRGLVLLDALYGGIGKFADWIADNRSTFFVSSYTPHTARHNVYLEHLLRERSVPYSSELRGSHSAGHGDVPAGRGRFRTVISSPMHGLISNQGHPAANGRRRSKDRNCRNDARRPPAQSLQGATKRAPRVLLAIRLGGVSS